MQLFEHFVRRSLAVHRLFAPIFNAAHLCPLFTELLRFAAKPFLRLEFFFCPFSALPFRSQLNFSSGNDNADDDGSNDGGDGGGGGGENAFQFIGEVWLRLALPNDPKSIYLKMRLGAAEREQKNLLKARREAGKVAASLTWDRGESVLRFKSN